LKISLYAGFDLGGTHLKYGIVEENGRILFKEKASSPVSAPKIVKNYNILKKKEMNISAKGIFRRAKKGV